MGTWQLVLVGLVMLLGLLGVLVPGVPGPLLVWAGILWWSMSEKTTPAWGVLIGATALLLVNHVVKWLLPARRLKGVGVTRQTVLWAGASAIVGFFVVPLIGAVLGFIAGIYGAERVRLGGHGEAWAATRTIMRAVGTSVLVELVACLLVLGAWMGAVIHG
ncbi:DUF456 domain-containing protein [Streptomyces sp. H27-D2]|uniref:DUF456 domain-containing protein n=1 Tax=Streptomyces sp. H27-D2 TaxID=3046304 RepID=UPI002DB62697|nr:DUF456 domain-containing protein [Streptomyces sp. H27-D2]MEC4019907.1 DUF456 domain-containing protein [Streptomyces sp. H27-D2]